MDVALLARLQFAITAGFHFIFPPLSIGLGLLLVVMQALYLRTRDPIYRQMTRFWLKIFGLVFGLGVATGIVLEFQFGTNWSRYSRFVGDVFGSPLAAEGVFSFFLESVFLGILLFGGRRVSERMYFFSTVMVALGAHLSALWIIAANSWQQTPAGFHLVEHGGMTRAEITDFWAMLWNPSTLDRYAHTIMAAWQTGAWLMVSVCSWHLLRRRHEAFARRGLALALLVALVAALGQLATGHSSAVGVSRHQPAKLAAFEGHYEETGSAELHLFGWVDEDRERVRFSVALPGMLSWLVHGKPDQPVVGLRRYAPEDRPPVNFVFQTYHLMVALGMGLIGLSVLGLLLLPGGRVFRARWLLWAYVLSVLGPHLANQLGWLSAEVGRQPWIVYGLLRTRDGLSPVVPAGQVLASLLLFTLIYLALLAIFLYLLTVKILRGPEEIEPAPAGGTAR
jgi:cytochrome d ubiquinol oxidase subunit I